MEATSHPSNFQNYHSSLHSTRKQPTKPWRKPATTTSIQRMHPKVYRVEPVNFKELVQRLTGSQDQEPKVEQALTETKPLTIFEETIITKENPFACDLSPSSSRFWEAFPLLSSSNLSRW
ncbi:unnamed protein product [Cochlearia groenlandica]